jgi:hypothetical protein
MNRLDPELKRLLRWSSRAGAPGGDEAPFGFAQRVAAANAPKRVVDLMSELQRVAWSSACLAGVVILCGILFLVKQPQAPETASDLTSALQFLASNFPR